MCAQPGKFQSVSLQNASDFLRRRTHSGFMTTSTAARRTALAAAFVAILLGVLAISDEMVHSVASVAAFATAIAVIAVAVIGWERVIANAESIGLVAGRESAPHF